MTTDSAKPAAEGPATEKPAAERPAAEGPAAEGPAASGPEAAFALFNDIGIIDQLASARLARVLPDGMQKSHFIVLNHFARLGGERTPVELARAFQVSKAAMTNTLQKLEAAGFVAVRPDARDGRMKRIGLTPEGRAARDRAIALLSPELADLARQVGPEALAVLAPGLRKLRETLDRARDGDPHDG